MGSRKRHQNIETSVEATKNEINKEIVHIKPPKYSNLSKGELKARHDLM